MSPTQGVQPSEVQAALWRRHPLQHDGTQNWSGGNAHHRHASGATCPAIWVRPGVNVRLVDG